MHINETREKGRNIITLLIIADDFTGAHDTGVKFVAGGAITWVITDIRYD